MFCDGCPVKDLCLKEINPAKYHYDGVAGGFVWVNGRPLEREFELMDERDRPFADHETLNKYLGRRLP